MGLNLFSRRPGWLYGALGLQEPRVPTQLDVDLIHSVLDTGQGGWGGANWRTRLTQVLPSQLADTRTVLPASTDFGYLITHFDFHHVAGAGPATYLLRIRDPDASQNVEILSIPVAVDGTWRSWQDTDHDFLVIPPNHQFQWNYPATGVGETHNLSYQYAEIRSGYKPI